MFENNNKAKFYRGSTICTPSLHKSLYRLAGTEPNTVGRIVILASIFGTQDPFAKNVNRSTIDYIINMTYIMYHTLIKPYTQNYKQGKLT